MKKFSILLSFIAVAVCASAQMAIPTLSSPSNGLTNATVRQTFSWSRITAATGYIFQLDTSATFSSPMLYEATQTNTSSSSTAPSRYHNYLHYNTTYYWRVRAYNATDTSDWSAVRNFHTDYHPYLSSPNNDTSSAGYYTRQNFQWQYFYGSTGYTLQVDTTPSFSSPLLRTETVTSSLTNTDNLSKYVYGMRFGTRYYWRVRAYHTEDTSDWSAVRQFRTQVRVSLYSPSNGLTNATVRQNLQWYNAVGCTSYQLQVDSSASFASPHLKTFTVTNTQSNTDSYLSQYVSYLLYGTHYYGRVRAINASDTSDWSNVWQFITDDKVYLSSPSNDTSSAGYYTRQNFQRQYFYGSTGYTLQVDTTPSFSSPLLVTENVTSSLSNTDNLSKYVDNMHFGTRYYWRVRAYHTQDTSGWSFVRQFCTQRIVGLNSPSADVTGQYTRINFQWNNARGCTSYTLQVDTSQTFSSPLLRTSTVSNTVSNTDSYVSTYVNNLRYGTRYYWRVQASNASSSSLWSVVRQFTTGVRPSLNDPSNNSTGYNISTYKLYWNNHRGSTSYAVQVDTTPTFSSPLLQSRNVTVSQTNTDNYIYTTPTGLRYGTTYYWRVRASNAADTSEWSLTWKFTTQYNVTTGPTLSSPANDSVGVAHNAAILSWQSLANMTGYRYWVSTNSSFTDTVAMATTSLTFTSLTNLYPSTTYYWKVQGSYATGQSNWSSAWHFSTADVPLAAPVLVAPINQGNVPQTSVSLSWQSVFGALTYQVQFSLDSLFQTAVSSYTTADTHYSISGLPRNMNYYWRVRSANNNATSDWSSIWTFSTNNCVPTFDTIDTAICQGDSYYFFGTPLSTTGTYSRRLSNVAGCDSTIILNLTVHPRGLNGRDTAMACDTYIWNGLTYTQSGNYPYYTQTTLGCDSMVVLCLSINHSSASIDTRAACDSLVWHDSTYTVSTSNAQFSTLNSEGCDSIVTLHLNIRYSVTNDTAFTTCDNYYWDGQTYTTSGSYTEHLFTTYGCDSTVTVHVTLYYSDTTHLYVNDACDSYVWNGVVLPNDGDYYDFNTTTHGCDSMVVLHLTINHSTASIDTRAACDSLVWHDSTYTASTLNAQFSTLNSEGCDSIVTIHLNIRYSVTNDTSFTTCDNYYWGGQTYTTSGSYTEHLFTTYGCDSTVTVHVTLYYSDTTHLYVNDACDSYVWNGAILPNDGDYYDFNTTAYGCDSTVILHLTLHHSTTGIDEQTACDSLTWIDGITYYSSTLNSQFSIPNAVGCDSLVTLHLTILPSYHGDIADTATDSYLWNGEEYTESGDYIQTFATTYGCDSVVTLHLVILSDSIGIATAEVRDIRVTVSDGQIIVEGAQGLPVVLYDVTGRVMYRKELSQSDQSLILNSRFSIPAGTYLLRIGNYPARKIVVVR